jgi:predicted nucleic acid-binding protein
VNVVDSSGWMAFFAGSRNADFFAPAIEDTPRLLVPALALFEVFRAIRRQRDEGAALQAVALMHQGRVIDLDGPLALAAGRLSIAERLPMADSIMLATARAHRATLWTQDADFRDLPDVRFVEA